MMRRRGGERREEEKRGKRKEKAWVQVCLNTPDLFDHA